MQVVPFEPKHFFQYNNWLKQWNLETPPPSYYPEYGGFIVENCAASFLYLTNTAIAFHENMIINPSLNKDERNTAINLVDDAIAAFAKINNVTAIMSRSNNQSLIQRAKNNGWIISEDKYNLMYKLEF